MGRIANAGNVAKLGYLQRRSGFKESNLVTPELMTRIQDGSAAGSLPPIVTRAAHSVGKVAGMTRNFVDDRPVMSGIAGAGLSYMALNSMFGGKENTGNATDAADSKLSGGLSPEGARSPVYNTYADMDGKLRQRTLQRLNEQIQLNQIYINAINNPPGQRPQE